MSVDVEDYFMVEAFAGTVPLTTWENWPSRVVSNTRRILDLFDRYNTRGTFFFVGWVAEKFPGLVRDVLARGHELACHSYWHRAVYSLTPDEFRKDTRAAVRAIEQAAGVKVHGYRAPSWTITKESLWALDILAEEGFAYDSSIYPVHHDLYGVPGAQRFPHTLTCANGQTLREYPPTTVRIFGTTLGAAGGGYLRILPLVYTLWAFRQIEQNENERAVVYVHPWEIDDGQPRIKDKIKSQLRHYTNLAGMEAKLEGLLQLYSFQCFREVYAEEKRNASISQATRIAKPVPVEAGSQIR